MKDRNEIDRLRVSAAAGGPVSSSSADNLGGPIDPVAHRILLQQYSIASKEAAECRAAYENAQRDLHQVRCFSYVLLYLYVP